MVDGKIKYCEESSVDPTCAAHTQPTPPSDCTPTEPEPNPCCTPELYSPPLTTTIKDCRWNCESSRCGTGTTFADGCVSVMYEGGVSPCQDDYVLTHRERYGWLCCPPTPTPTPTPTPEPTPTPPSSPCPAGCGGFIKMEFEQSHTYPSCGGSVDWCTYPDTGCPSAFYGYNWEDTCCCNQPQTPVLIDVAGDGLRLTGNRGGFHFQISNGAGLCGGSPSVLCPCGLCHSLHAGAGWAIQPPRRPATYMDSTQGDSARSELVVPQLKRGGVSLISRREGGGEFL